MVVDHRGIKRRTGSKSAIKLYLTKCLGPRQDQDHPIEANQDAWAKSKRRAHFNVNFYIHYT